MGRVSNGLEACPMPAYLVRIINTRDIVGFFFADDLDDLLTTIDECTERAANMSNSLPEESIGSRPR
jgi:hypothetical protein